MSGVDSFGATTMFSNLHNVIYLIFGTLSLYLVKRWWPLSATIVSVNNFSILGKYVLPSIYMIIFGIIDASGFFIFDIDEPSFQKLFGFHDPVVVYLVIGALSATFALINSENMEHLLHKIFPMVYLIGPLWMHIIGLILGSAIVIGVYMIRSKLEGPIKVVETPGDAMQEAEELR